MNFPAVNSLILMDLGYSNIFPKGLLDIPSKLSFGKARSTRPGTEIPALKFTPTSGGEKNSSWEAPLIPKIPLIIQIYPKVQESIQGIIL